ncbi:MAG TPA: hypothetical protein VL027_01000, partial [Spongiibacteraceae bacterium]|nr:hypothetical protein [Spongiibacteraceae bacterium]
MRVDIITLQIRGGPGMRRTRKTVGQTKEPWATKKNAGLPAQSQGFCIDYAIHRKQSSRPQTQTGVTITVSQSPFVKSNKLA